MTFKTGTIRLVPSRITVIVVECKTTANCQMFHESVCNSVN